VYGPEIRRDSRPRQVPTSSTRGRYFSVRSPCVTFAATHAVLFQAGASPAGLSNCCPQRDARSSSVPLRIVRARWRRCGRPLPSWSETLLYLGVHLVNSCRRGNHEQARRQSVPNPPFRHTSWALTLLRGCTGVAPGRLGLTLIRCATADRPTPVLACLVHHRRADWTARGTEPRGSASRPRLCWAVRPPRSPTNSMRWVRKPRSSGFNLAYLTTPGHVLCILLDWFCAELRRRGRVPEAFPGGPTLRERPRRQAHLFAGRSSPRRRISKRYGATFLTSRVNPGW